MSVGLKVGAVGVGSTPAVGATASTPHAGARARGLKSDQKQPTSTATSTGLAFFVRLRALDHHGTVPVRGHARVSVCVTAMGLGAGNLGLGRWLAPGDLTAVECDLPGSVHHNVAHSSASSGARSTVILLYPKYDYVAAMLVMAMCCG